MSNGFVWDAVMQGDGNLVLYDPYAHALWASATAGNVGAWVVVQNDGNLVIYDANNKPLWASNTMVLAGQPAAPTATDRLTANQGLTPGQSIKSQDGRFTLIFQTDGNLVLYAPGGQALWAANTAGHVVWEAIMQGDGNLVVYDPQARPLWAAGTNGHAGAWLVVQNDGNLVIYDANNKPLWASNTMVLAGQPAAPTATDHLTANQGLTPGQSIKSQDGRFTLIFQTDGNLVLYAPGGQALWAANTAGHVVWEAIMQGDGNLVVYDPQARPLWAAGTNGHAGAWLVVQNDGNLVIYDANNKPLWASNTMVLAGQPAAPTATDHLTANQGLTPGQSIKSQDGRFTLIFQTDGNLVLYAPGGQALWAANTAGHVVWEAIMQGDGNLVVYDPQARPLWAAGTNGHAGAWLVVQNDGNLVIYDANNKPLWASNTMVLAGQPAAPTATDHLTANQGLTPGQSIKSQDGRFTLIFQTDGNLVLYAPGGQALWAANTAGHVVWEAIMQGDGNLVVYDPQARPLWAAGTNGHAGAWLVVQNDGNLVIYDANNKPLWASNTMVLAGQPAAPTATDHLTANQGLTPGQSIKSQDGRFTLIFQTDGNLVLYAPGGQALWASGFSFYLELKEQPQQESNWCWSATTVSITIYYDPASPWTQCTLVNKAFNQTTCCQNGSSNNCNQPWYPDQALSITGHLNSATGGSLSLSAVMQQIRNSRPISISIYWNGGGGHNPAIDGFDATDPTVPVIEIEDPIFGHSTQDFNSFPTTYQGGAKWGNSFLTR